MPGLELLAQPDRASRQWCSYRKAPLWHSWHPARTEPKTSPDSGQGQEWNVARQGFLSLNAPDSFLFLILNRRTWERVESG